MNSYYSSASFIKMYDINKNLTRVVDLVKTPSLDGVKNPDLFYYEFLLKNNRVNYNLPVEGLNQGRVITTMTSLLPTSSRDELLFYSNCFLPQTSSGTEDINSIGSIISIEDNNQLYSNIYVVGLPGERYMEVYEASDNPEDPYGIQDNSTLNLLLNEVDLGEEILSGTIIVVGVGLNSVEDWVYKNPILENLSKPVDSFIGSPKSNTSQTNTISKEDLETLTDSYTIESGVDFLKIRSRIVNSVPETIVKDTSGVVSTNYTDPF